jgi:hypothetical protein
MCEVFFLGTARRMDSQSPARMEGIEKAAEDVVLGSRSDMA